MTKTIWYISKYVAPSYAAKVGSRGFLILKEFSRQGHKALLITSDSNHLANVPSLSRAVMHEEVDGVDVHWVRTLKYGNARSLRRMLSWIDFEWKILSMSKKNLPKPDFIIVSSLSLLTVLNGIYLSWRYSCKFIFEVRDIWPMILVETGGISLWNPFVIFLSWVEKLGYRKADLIVGTMPNLAAHVKSVVGIERPVVCVPQGIDPALLESSLPLSKDYISIYIPKEKFIVCHAGSIGSDNALETLFACAREMQDNKKIHFLIVGEGYFKDSFRRNNSDLFNVTFAPGVPKASVQALLAFVDVVYFAVHKTPTLNFGQSLNKVIDYMLSGKPVIASYTGFPSMINEAACGSYVPAEDVSALRTEIEKFAGLPSIELAAMGGRGKRWLLDNRRFETLAADYLRYMAAI